MKRKFVSIQTSPDRPPQRPLVLIAHLVCKGLLLSRTQAVKSSLEKRAREVGRKMRKKKKILRVSSALQDLAGNKTQRHLWRKKSPSQKTRLAKKAAKPRVSARIV